MTITTPNTTPTTSGRTARAPRRRAGRTLTAILGPMSLLFAVGCGVEPAAQDAPAALAQEATGSAAYVERPVLDIAEHTRQWRIENARGSDRHLERAALDIAEHTRQWRVANALANDRHLERTALDIAEHTTQWRIENARGSDRHLEMLAAELAATADRT